MSEVLVRPATRDDLAALVALLADDDLGRTRERPGDPPAACYATAFDEIQADAGQELVVADRDGEVVGMLQLTVMSQLSRQGSRRAQIEGVRVGSAARGLGVGTRLVEWAVERARARGCRLIQLTSDRSRERAHRFYERLGFEVTHVGMKRDL